jgi:hypothetical protein
VSQDLFVTFGDGRRGFRLAAQRLVQEVQDSDWKTDLLLLNNDSARVQIGQDWIEHEEWMKTTPRGYGFWVWKSIILKHALRGTFGDYRRVVYLDSGCQFSLKNNPAKKRFSEYLEILDTHGGMAFAHRTGQFGISDFTDEVWGKKELHDAIYAPSKILKSNQILAGCLFLTPRILDVIEKWCDWATKDDYRYLRNPMPSELQLPNFKAHRQDQSILSVLWKGAGLPTIPDETWFAPKWGIEASQFPIWTIRNDSSIRLPSDSARSRFAHKFEVNRSLILDKLNF